MLGTRISKAPTLPVTGPRDVSSLTLLAAGLLLAGTSALAIGQRRAARRQS